MRFDITDLDDIVDKFKDLLNIHNGYDSTELIENSESFEQNLDTIISELYNFSSDASSEFEDLEEKIGNLQTDLENVENSEFLQYSNMTGLLKRRICLDLYNNLTLEELEELENSIKKDKKIYSVSMLSDAEID